MGGNVVPAIVAEGQQLLVQSRTLERTASPQPPKPASRDFPGSGLPERDVDRLAAYVAGAYLADVKNDDAARAAERAVALAPMDAPLSHGNAGLAECGLAR